MTIQDIQADPNTSKDPEMKKEQIRRKAELEKKKESHEKSPGEKLEELVKSHYDYTTNAFPKGEQAVITACEKEFAPITFDPDPAVAADVSAPTLDAVSFVQS